MRDFRGLEVWQLAHAVTLAIYKHTGRFPREELFGITSQMRRCSASIAANIAEGCGRNGDGDFHRFLQVASGSASELDYHLILARDLTLLGEADYQELSGSMDKLRRKLTTLLLKVEQDPNSSRAFRSKNANGERRMANGERLNGRRC